MNDLYLEIAKPDRDFPGNIRDRREDAEALLRETADVLHAARTQGVLAQSDTATHLLALAARMVCR